MFLGGWADDVEAEVMAAARLKTNAKREQVYLEFGLPVRKLKPVPNKREKPRRCAVQIELFAESGQAEDADSVQGNHDSVQSAAEADRKSTRLNSSHLVISYAVFC